MSKVLVIIFSLIVIVLLPETSYAQSYDTPCSNPNLQYQISITTTDPSAPTTPKAGENFNLNFSSPNIKKGTKYPIKIRTDNQALNTGGQIRSLTIEAKDDGLMSSPNLKLGQEGTYRVLIFKEDWLKGEEFVCRGDPFSIATSSIVTPKNSCSVEAKIQNKKIVVSGTGTITSDSYFPLINRSDSQQVLLGKEVPVKSNGSFGPEEYDLPLNYSGGNTTITVQHSYYTDVTCTSNAVNVPKTAQANTACKNIDDPKFQEGDTPCTSSGGISCDIYDGATAEVLMKRGMSKPGEFFKNLPSGNVGVWTAVGCIPTNPTKLIESLLKLATGVGGGIALLLFVAGVLQMITSAGNPEAVKKGSEQMTAAIIGLLFIIFSVMLLKVIGVDILQIPGFGK